MTVRSLFELSRGWYTGRLERDFTPRTRDVLQQQLTAAGMTEEFWQLT